MERAGLRTTPDGERADLWLPSGGVRLEERLQSLSLPADVLIGAVPGARALANKRRLWARLVKAYGRPQASTIAPETWLPDVAADRAALERLISTGDKHLYVVKDAGKQRRTGVVVTEDPLGEIGDRDPTRFVVQRLVTNQLLLAETACSLRCWVVLVRDRGEVQAHLFQGGVVVYATGGDNLGERWITQRRQAAMPTGAPTTMSMLFTALSAAGADPRVLQSGIVRAIRAATKAVIGDMKTPVLADNRCFELLGVDFVVQTDLTPRLLELNWMPTLEPRSEAELPLRNAVIQGAFALGGVPGFAPSTRYTEVGRWSLR